MMNFISLELTAGADPETHSFNNGNSVTSVRACLNQGYYDKDKQWQDQGSAWFDVQAATASAVKQLGFLHKGERFIASGYYQKRFWTDKHGVQRETDCIRAISVSKLLKSAQPQDANDDRASQSFGGFGSDPWSAPAGEPDF